MCCRFGKAAGNGAFNPLQDLVNEVANASASGRSAARSAAADRYATVPVLASLQIDDSVNMGESTQPSPAVALQRPPVPALFATISPKGLVRLLQHTACTGA